MTRRLRPGWRLGLFVAGLALVVVAFNLAWRRLGLPPQRSDGVLNPTSLFALAGLVLVATLALSAVLLRRFEDRSLTTMGLALREGSWWGIVIGTITGAAPPTLFVAIGAFFGYATVGDAVVVGGYAATGILLLVLASIALAVGEELLFRGYGLQQLAQGLGAVPAVIVTGVLFGLAHGFNPGANPVGLVLTSASAVLLAWITVRTGSLWIAIGNHVAWNLTAQYALGLETSGIESGPSLRTTTLEGSAWLTGGDYGFEGSLVTGAIDFVVVLGLVAVVRYLPTDDASASFFRRRPSDA